MSLPLTEVLQQIAGRHVLVIGDVIVDEYLVGDSSRISSEAPVPVLRYTGEHATLGGAGNTAANVTSLGGAATLIGLVGDDAAGADLARRCAAARIDLVPLRDGRPTTRKVRVISQRQQLLRIDYEETASIDAAHERELLDAIAPRLAACDIVVVSDYAKGLLTNEACREIVRRAQAAGKPVVVDPRPQHASFYWECDYLTPNWRESLGLLGEGEQALTPENVRRVGTLVTRRFRSNVLLTLGPLGIAFFDRDGGEPLMVPAEAQEVFDVSGAGDTVVAAFALARAAGCPHAAAVMLANRAAAVVVGKRGTATVTPDELLEVVRQLRVFRPAPSDPPLPKQSRFDQLDQQVHHLDVYLLNPIGRRARHDDRVIAGVPQGAAVAAKEAHHAEASRACRLDGGNQVRALAGRREHDQRVARLAPRLDASREDALEAVVVGDTRQMGGVGHCLHRECRPVVAEAPRHFLGEVHRVAERPAVAAGEHAAARPEHAGQMRGDPLDGAVGALEIAQPGRERDRVVERGLDRGRAVLGVSGHGSSLVAV